MHGSDSGYVQFEAARDQYVIWVLGWFWQERGRTKYFSSWGAKTGHANLIRRKCDHQVGGFWSQKLDQQE